MHRLRYHYDVTLHEVTQIMPALEGVYVELLWHRNQAQAVSEEVINMTAISYEISAVSQQELLCCNNNAYLWTSSLNKTIVLTKFYRNAASSRFERLVSVYIVLTC